MTDQKTAASCPLPDGVAIPVEVRLDRKTVRLARPIKHGGRLLEQLEVAPLKGAHVRRFPESGLGDEEKNAGTGKLLELAGQLTELPDSCLDELSGVDVGEVTQAVLQVSWPAFDLPVQWESAWARERAAAELERRPSKAPAELPDVRGGYLLELEHPVKVKERDIVTRLAFGEVTGRLARRFPLSGLPVCRLPWLVGELTGAPKEAVDELTGRDLNRALALAQLFFFAIRGASASSG